MNQGVKGFFFDLDGTLVETDRANYLAYKRALKEIGVDLSFDSFKKTTGMSSKRRLPIFAPELPAADYDAIYKRKSVYYKDLLHHTTPNRELLRFMNDVKATSQLVLVTTAIASSIEDVLTHHQLLSLFDYIVAREDVKNLKPHPEAYRKALELTALQPNEAIAFEDSETGIAAARAAGIAVITVKDFWP